ncbi:hypothetical protein ACFV0Z_12745 [Streptomyces xiamenensis]|uniref:hypothetical protein n=1 Tax=Streptomyces xiamenensis TaxID=408015 RepID=UPI0036B71A4C
MIGLLRRLAVRLTRRPAAVDTPTIRLRLPGPAHVADRAARRALPALPGDFRPDSPGHDERAMGARLRTRLEGPDA